MSGKSGSRSAQIVRYNIIGVILNVILCVIKMAIGMVIHAHAIIMDGVNGLSDILSYVISIFSAKLSDHRADKSHPFGYGRVEYLCSMIVTVLICVVGVRAIVDSVQALFQPHEAPDYNTAAIIIMCVSLVAKLGYGLLMVKKGKELGAIGMRASGIESMGDAVISVAILAAIVLQFTLNVDIEHYVTIVIGLMILQSGLIMIRDCMRKLVGTRASDEVRDKTVKILIAEKEVLNVYNMALHDYGEQVYVGAADIEIDENMKASEISMLTRRLIRKAEKAGIRLTSIGISGTNLTDPETIATWDTILDTVVHYKSIIRAHSFVEDRQEKVISFFIVQDPGNRKRREEKAELQRMLEGLFPDRNIEIYDGVND